MTPHQQQLIAELKGNRCRCGAGKSSRMTFCKGCYFSLPKPIRQALYRLIGRGYEEAYAQAIALLDRKGGAT